MNINYKVSFVFKLLFIFLKKRNFTEALFFARLKGGSNIELINKFSLTGNILRCKSTGRSINISKLSIFDHDIFLLNEAFEKFLLEEKGNCLYMSITKHGKLLTLQINNFDSLGTFHEILVKDVYETIINEDLVVIDVGMNVGTAALSFAANDRIKKVYGFEPVPATCAIAEENLKLNGAIGEKVEVACVALGKGNKTIHIPLTIGGSVGASTTDFVMEKLHKPTEYNSTIEITVKDSAVVINTILQRHVEKILLKLDCEGAEYEIIEDLFEKGVLNKISFIIIEWHYKSKYILTDKLAQAGFSLFVPDITAIIPAGLIYGINTNPAEASI